MAKSRLTKRQRKRLQKTLEQLNPKPSSEFARVATIYEQRENELLKFLAQKGFVPNQLGKRRLLDLAKKAGLY